MKVGEKSLFLVSLIIIIIGVNNICLAVALYKKISMIFPILIMRELKLRATEILTESHLGTEVWGVLDFFNRGI